MVLAGIGIRYPGAEIHMFYEYYFVRSFDESLTFKCRRVYRILIIFRSDSCHMSRAGYTRRMRFREL